MLSPKVLVMLARLAWVIALIIGVLIYGGHTLRIEFHVIPGAIVAFSLIGLALMARPVAGFLSVIGVLVALLLPVVGLLQLTDVDSLKPSLTGVHILLALASIALSEILAKKLRSKA